MKAGDVFTLVRTCEPLTPIYFAAASGDFNPIHLDETKAKEAGLGGVILQGLCTLSWAVDAFARYLGDPAMVRSIAVRFSRPVSVGDVITFTGSVTSTEGDRVQAELRAVNQHGLSVLKGVRVEGGSPFPAALPRSHAGVSYVYEAGLEKMREFAYAVSGGVPSTGFSAEGPPADLHPSLHDVNAGPVMAMPTFAVNFAFGPFAAALRDPASKIDLLRVVHGEQRFEFFAPVHPGDRLTTTGFVSAMTPQRSLEVTSETINQRGEPVVRGVWTAIIRG